VNSVIRFLFNIKVAEKRGLWVPCIDSIVSHVKHGSQ